MSSSTHKKNCRIIFLGSRPLGKLVLEWLIHREDFEVVGILLYPKDRDRYWKEDPWDIADNFGLLPEKSLEDLKEMNFDMGLSVNYHKILDTKILNLAPLGFWNIHHSYNLRLKGRNITTHAILRAKQDHIHYHGTTLHQMVEELDNGPIAASRSCPIKKNDTAYSLFNRVDDYAFKLIKEWVPRIAHERVFPYPPPWEGSHVFRTEDLPDRKINVNWDGEKIYDHVRSFEFPPFQPAYYEKDGKLFELSVESQKGFDKFTEIKGRQYKFRRKNQI